MSTSLLSPRFSKKHKKLDKVSGGKSTSTKEKIRRVNDVLVAVSNPTLSNPTLLSDVITSEDVLKEENAKTVSRKTIISRPIERAPDVEGPRTLERQLSSKSFNEYDELSSPVRKDAVRDRASSHYTPKHSKNVRWKKSSDVQQWTSKPTERKIELSSPVLGICSSGTSEFVTSSVDGCVRVHDLRTGEILNTLQIFPGVDHRQKFQAAMTKDGNFVVASGNAVTLWSSQGRLLHEYGVEKFKFCKQLCLTDDGIVAVTDPDNNCAAVLSVDGNWFHLFGAKGFDQGDFNCPTGVTILGNGDIAVADWESRIQLFDRFGRFHLQFGAKGKQDGELDLPYGLTCDSKDNIIVADWWNNRVSAFTRDGEFLRHLLSSQDGIVMPAYVCVPPQGKQLVLSEFGSLEIKMFFF